MRPENMYSVLEGSVMTDPTHIPVWRTCPPKQCWYRRRDHVCTLYQAWHDDELICDNDDEHPAKCPAEIKPKEDDTMTEPTRDMYVTLTLSDFQDILIYAERYAIGRMTYAPKDVCDMIMSNIRSVTRNTLSVLIRDIEREQERDNLGNPKIDAPVWISTLEALKEELESRS